MLGELASRLCQRRLCLVKGRSQLTALALARRQLTPRLARGPLERGYLLALDLNRVGCVRFALVPAAASARRSDAQH